MANISGRHFSPFRIPAGWNEEERSLVRQIQDLFDRLFNMHSVVGKSSIDFQRTGTNGTFDVNLCNKVGHIVTFSARVHSMTANNTANGVFFKMPEGYRPKVTTPLVGAAYVGSTFVPTMWTVSPNGEISLSYSNNATAGQVYVAGSFPV